MIDYVGILIHCVVFGVCVTTFWKAAEMEESTSRGPAVIWAGLSAILFLLIWLVLGWGWPALVGGQMALLVGIGVIRAIFSGNAQE